MLLRPALFLKTQSCAFRLGGLASSFQCRSLCTSGTTLPWIHKTPKPSTKTRSVSAVINDKRSSWDEAADQFFANQNVQNPSSSAVEESEQDEEDDTHRSDERWLKIKEKVKKMAANDEKRGPEIQTEDRTTSPLRDRPMADEEGFNERRNLRNGFAEKGNQKTRRHQEEWGRRTWKDITRPSSIPKLEGETIYGVGPVLASLSIARREFYTLYLQEGMNLSSRNKKKKDKEGIELILDLAANLGLVTKELSKHDLNMLVGSRPHQGLVLDASPLQLIEIKELDPVRLKGRAPLWLALDEVTDPQNFGAVLRSAYFFGASGVVVCSKNSAPPTGVVSKASAGALELIELRSCRNMMQFLTGSEKNGWRVLGACAGEDAVPVSSVGADSATVLVVGSEGRGLRTLVRHCCSQLVSVPGSALPSVVPRAVFNGAEVQPSQVSEFNSFFKVESLNVSVATGILLYHLSGFSSKSAVAPKEIE
eukprot:TRINITY_DN1251_c0_g1_i1.p1 TRINITY_DN1251_c0_g1~~TRINITY_DN1251_c0_g1_i1.p1  ORF type:complete len:479 (+),score=69.43 TRINITY_DN1251_c0_g1_i1:76-1512(+)